MTEKELRSRARELLAPGINPYVALVIAYAELSGEPLDPWAFDDAALILRAEHLLMEGLDVATAVATARAEFATFAEAGS